MLSDLAALKVTAQVPSLAAWGVMHGAQQRCRRVIQGCKQDAPTRTLRHTPRPPTKHNNKKREEQRGLGSLFSLGGLANHKQGPVHTVHGDPCILPVTKPQLRWVGAAAVRGHTAAHPGSGWGGRWAPGLERGPRPQTVTPRKECSLLAHSVHVFTRHHLGARQISPLKGGRRW